MVIVFDETGGNTSQKGDGHMGGQLLMCEKGKTPQTKISTRDKHYAVMGLTSLTGHPVMCIVIFSGKKPNALWETGLDLEAETFRSPEDDDYFFKQFRTRKTISRRTNLPLPWKRCSLLLCLVGKRWSYE